MQHTVSTTTERAEAAWLERLLREEIPLARAMDLGVTRLDETGIELRTPLAPNRNDKGTAFGGSILSLMTLAGWGLLRVLLERESIRADLVIARCEARFIAPLASELVVRCAWPPVGELDAFRRRFQARGRARLQLAPELSGGEGAAAIMEAEFAAVSRE